MPFRGEMSCGFKAYRILLSLLTGTPDRNAASHYIPVGKDQARFCPSGEKCGPCEQVRKTLISLATLQLGLLLYIGIRDAVMGKPMLARCG